MVLGAVFRLPLGVLLALLLGIMLLTLELGLWRGTRAREGYDDRARSYASGLHAALLGFLALLLGFAFSLSASHFVTNRDLVAEEANAVDTAFRRADLAPDPERGAIKASLRRYAETRIAYYGEGIDEARRRTIDDESLTLQDDLWRRTAAVAERAPTCPVATLVQAINRVIEIHETRADAARNHVPPAVMWLLVVMSAAATGLTGYVSAFGNRHHAAPTAVVLVVIGLVLVAIVDLDRPLRALVHGGQPGLLKLRRLMAIPTAAR
jgi:hypothetical protein